MGIRPSATLRIVASRSGFPSILIAGDPRGRGRPPTETQHTLSTNPPQSFASRPFSKGRRDEGIYVAVHGGRRLTLAGDWLPPETLLVGHDDDWADATLSIARASMPRTRVIVVPSSDDRSSKDLARHVAGTSIEVSPMATNSPWVRDFTPLQCRTPTGKWAWVGTECGIDRELDSSFADRLAKHFHHARPGLRAPIEGGGVASNGKGLCVITRTTLNDAGIDSRCPGTMAAFLQAIGTTCLVVAPAIPAEETGHIDLVVQFASPTTVIVAKADRDTSPDAAEALDRNCTHARGRSPRAATAARSPPSGDAHHGRHSLLVHQRRPDPRRCAHAQLPTGLHAPRAQSPCALGRGVPRPCDCPHSVRSDDTARGGRALCYGTCPEATNTRTQGAPKTSKTEHINRSSEPLTFPPAAHPHPGDSPV